MNLRIRHFMIGFVCAAIMLLSLPNQQSAVAQEEALTSQDLADLAASLEEMARAFHINAKNASYHADRLVNLKATEEGKRSGIRGDLETEVTTMLSNSDPIFSTLNQTAQSIGRASIFELAEPNPQLVADNSQINTKNDP